MHAGLIWVKLSNVDSQIDFSWYILHSGGILIVDLYFSLFDWRESMNVIFFTWKTAEGMLFIYIHACKGTLNGLMILFISSVHDVY